MQSLVQKERHDEGGRASGIERPRLKADSKWPDDAVGTGDVVQQGGGG